MIDPMLSSNSPLRVRRVRGYRVPRYPSHTDPDPTTNPEPVPYPWKSGVAAALLALGDTSCAKEEATVAKVVDEIVAESMREKPKGDRNPFAQALGFSGLPHVSSPYGTGAPTRLDNALAQDLITRIFAAEGLKTQPATFAEKDFMATAQGYDPEKRIGYILGNWENLDGTAVGSWMSKELQKIASGEREVENPKDPEVLKNIDSTAGFLFREAGKREGLKQELEAITKIDTARAKAQACLALAAKLDEPKLSMAEIRRAEKMAEDHQRYLAIITVFDRRFESYHQDDSGFYKRMNDIRKQAEQRKFANDAEKWEWIQQQDAPIQAEMQREKLVKLAQSVREYIAWARRNGLQ